MNENYVQLILPGFEDVEVVKTEHSLTGNQYYCWKQQQETIKKYHGFTQLELIETSDKEKE